MKGNTLIVLILACMAVSASALPDESPGNPPPRLFAVDEGIELLFAPVNSEGATVGFSVEILNLSKNASLLFLLRKDLERTFRVRLRNLQGLEVSPVPRAYPEINPPRRDWSTIRIPARCSYRVFITVPKFVLADPTNFSNTDNLVAITKGEYKASLGGSFEYGWHEGQDAPKSERDIAWRSKLLSWRISPANPDAGLHAKEPSPEVAIAIDPDKLTKDPFDSFLEAVRKRNRD